MTSTFYHINKAHFLSFFKNTPPKLLKMTCYELASDFLPHYTASYFIMNNIEIILFMFISRLFWYAT